ncbi:unnamed protein product [Microthlaspi erraticum]|uniref:Uncharacterized protein n=1 Tax=Microthlaspi erraticum TaxID=1685480 RepID=A0A6D2JJT2_9BRAS|nr:unnamed protein product [Microthlaspi erraticum]
MKQMILLSILCFLFISFGVASVSAQTCMNDYQKFKPNGTYDANRRLILSSLPSNVTAQDGFFYSASIGQEPNRVYATGMCIPDSTPEMCTECIKNVTDGLIKSCPEQTNAFNWTSDPTLCYVRYSDTSFSGTFVLYPYTVLTRPGNTTSNLTDFKEIWDRLISRLVNAASAAKSTPSSSNNHYAADSAALTPGQNIYALMQCTPDISSSDCEACLRRNIVDYQGCCGLKQGGVVMQPSCYLRWELYTYFNAFGNIRVASPPPQPPVSVPVPVPQPSEGSKGISAGVVLAITVPTVVIVFILIVLGLSLFRRRKSFQRAKIKSGITTLDSLQFDFHTIEVATENFTSSNKLGQGGFGEVFKGTLPNGTEVAVKRLSKASEQGAEEFKNEVVVVAKLQHRNLVRLLGFCLEREEKLLIFEYVHNKSLDYFLFDPTKQGQLDWTKRYNIIRGITRGILYLHQDSRLTIIHRDLKASNILLDADMNPKIADFGMARIFGMDQTGANTNRIAGTRGYMSPEYVMQGRFSTKSDVYSFGVIVLEIISGQKTRFVHQSHTIVENLVTYAWRLWRNGSPLELVDPAISENCQPEEVTRCIHIALLCVQHNPTDRPTLSTIDLMLTSMSLLLSSPHQPGFFFPNRRNQERDGSESSQSTIRSTSHTINEVTITDLDPR